MGYMRYYVLWKDAGNSDWLFCISEDQMYVWLHAGTVVADALEFEEEADDGW